MFEGKHSKLKIFLVFFTVFVNSIELFREPFEFYLSYVVMILFLPPLFNKHGIKPISMVMALFAFLFINGIVQIANGNNTPALFFKIIFGVMFSYIFYYLVVAEAEFNVKKLFDLYLKGCYIVSVIGIIQFIGFLIKVPVLYDYGWLLNLWGIVRGGNFGIRINSVFPEPTFFATSISAAVFVAIHNFLTKENYFFTKFEGLIIIIAYLLSYSGVGYMGLFVILLLIFMNYGFIRYLVVFLPLFVLLFYQLYQNVPEFKDRYDSGVELATTGKFKIGKTHGSSLILYNNFQVALKNFENYPLGTGLGSHPIAFKKYSLTKDIKIAGIDGNGMDANSMFNRLLSETGVIGVGLFFLLIVKGFVKRNTAIPVNSSYWIISNATLTLILLNLLRQGHYFLNGFPLLVWIYYYNRQNYLRELDTLDQIPTPPPVGNELANV